MEPYLEQQLLKFRNVGPEAIKILKRNTGKYKGMATLFYLQMVNDELLNLQGVRSYICEEGNGKLYGCSKISSLLKQGKLSGYIFKRRVFITRNSIHKALADGTFN